MNLVVVVFGVVRWAVFVVIEFAVGAHAAAECLKVVVHVVAVEV